MRLHTARQAWHDASYSQSSSPIARCAEIARLGAGVQVTAWHDSNNRAAHIAQAGLILQAIGTLPRHLQQVGDWLYAPLTTEHSNRIVEDVQEIVWQKSGLLLTGKARERAYWLVRAVMSDYQDLVLGRRVRLNTPQNIRAWLLDWHSVDMRTNKDWWQREAKHNWVKFWHTLDDLDAAAIAPVAAVVAREKKEAV